MSNFKQRLVIYVDTSCLSHMAKTQTVVWHKLLHYAESSKTTLESILDLEIHIHEIVLEEYRTQSRDHLQAYIEKYNDSLDKLKEIWKKNPVGKNLAFPPIMDFLPNHEQIDEESRCIVKDLLKNRGVIEVKFKEQHSQLVWSNYFSWKRPFDNATHNLRDDKTHREKRKTHIPDAWIYAAAVEIKTQAQDIRLLVLCKDGNLAKALKAENIEVYENAEDVLNIIESIKSEHSESIPLLSKQPENIVSNVDSAAHAMNSLEKDLITIILGYIGWFTPIAKIDLMNFIQQKGYDIHRTTNAIDRLTLNGFITDTGNYYIPANKAVCENAKNLIMAEILHLLEE